MSKPFTTFWSILLLAACSHAEAANTLKVVFAYEVPSADILGDECALMTLGYPKREADAKSFVSDAVARRMADSMELFGAKERIEYLAPQPYSMKLLEEALTSQPSENYVPGVKVDFAEAKKFVKSIIENDRSMISEARGACRKIDSRKINSVNAEAREALRRSHTDILIYLVAWYVRKNASVGQDIESTVPVLLTTNPWVLLPDRDVLLQAARAGDFLKVEALVSKYPPVGRPGWFPIVNETMKSRVGTAFWVSARKGIFLDVRFPETRRIYLHELGHYVGLDHTFFADDTDLSPSCLSVVAKGQKLIDAYRSAVTTRSASQLEQVCDCPFEHNSSGSLEYRDIDGINSSVQDTTLTMQEAEGLPLQYFDKCGTVKKYSNHFGGTAPNTNVNIMSDTKGSSQFTPGQRSAANKMLISFK